MTELDFDELDQAVNSLMADVSATKKEAKKDETVLDLDAHGALDASATLPVVGPATDPTVVADIAPAAPEEVPTPAEQPVAVAAVTPVVSDPEPANDTPGPMAPRPASLAVKRRGQFMDVMHPSADMKAQVIPTKREGIRVQPSPALSATPVEAPASESEDTKADASQDNSPESTAWPDPIDMASEVETTHAEPESPHVATEPVIEEAADLPALTEPQTSPFLPNAVVEKRPLGGAQASDALLLDSNEPSEAANAATDAQVAPVEAVPQAAALPAELHTELMALESSDTAGDAKPEKSAEPDSSNVTSQLNSVVPTPVASDPQPSTVGGSIPQQYKEQASSGDAVNSAIYDTSTHHQPLDITEHKKHSPVKWIVIGLVILIIGAVAGAAYFYFTTNS
jgi:hypothetical protein